MLACIGISCYLYSDVHLVTSSQIIDQFLLDDNLKLQKQPKEEEVSWALSLIKERENIFARDSVAYYKYVSELIHSFKCQSGAEIGCLYGGLSEKILQGNPQISNFYLVDPFAPSFFGSPILANTLYIKLKLRLSKYKNISFMRKFSTKAAATIPNNSLDFVFIDGAHDYESVCEDISAWVPKIKKGGLIIGDDYYEEFPGVIKAVNEFAAKNKYTNKLQFACNRIWHIVKD